MITFFCEKPTAFGYDACYWQVQEIQVDFVSRILVARVAGWTELGLMSNTPIVAITLEWSDRVANAVLQEWQSRPEGPVPDVSQYQCPLTPDSFRYDRVVEEVMKHPVFIGAELVDLEKLTLE